MEKDLLHFEKGNGILPAVVQDYRTGEVLMLAYMNREAWEKTLSSGQAHYFSRSRQALWVKGATSGHTQAVKEIRVDCDGDTILLKVEQKGGGACHTGYRTCFFRRVDPDGQVTLVGERAFDPEEVYGR